MYHPQLSMGWWFVLFRAKHVCSTVGDVVLTNLKRVGRGKHYRSNGWRPLKSNHSPFTSHFTHFSAMMANLRCSARTKSGYCGNPPMGWTWIPYPEGLELHLCGISWSVEMAEYPQHSQRMAAQKGPWSFWASCHPCVPKRRCICPSSCCRTWALHQKSWPTSTGHCLTTFLVLRQIIPSSRC